MIWQSIPVTVTRSARARKVWLKMRSCVGLEVVLPYRVSASEVPGILERHREWILTRLADLGARNEAPGQNPLPESIPLAFLDREYSVRYEDAHGAELHADGDALRVFFPSGQIRFGPLLLQRWLISLGKRHLVPFCRELAGRHGVRVSSVQVRNQSSRWGSCSTAFGISLNAKLLFLPPHLARHIVLHELCHVEHRNHGPAFWSALRSLDPLTDGHEDEIRQAWDGLPAWSKWRESKG